MKLIERPWYIVSVLVFSGNFCKSGNLGPVESSPVENGRQLQRQGQEFEGVEEFAALCKVAFETLQ